MTVFALVDDDGALPPPLSRIAMAETDTLRTIHDGDHQLLGYAYRALLAQVDARGLTAAGDAREYYSPPSDGPLRTRLVVPVA